jgi:hypothetical protein
LVKEYFSLLVSLFVIRSFIVCLTNIHADAIAVNTHLHKGTTFSVTLPIRINQPSKEIIAELENKIE